LLHKGDNLSHPSEKFPNFQLSGDLG